MTNGIVYKDKEYYVRVEYREEHTRYMYQLYDVNDNKIGPCFTKQKECMKQMEDFNDTTRTSDN